jgi:hypothetical protein
MGDGRHVGMILLPLVPAVVAMFAVLIRNAEATAHMQRLTLPQLALNALPLLLLAAAWFVTLKIIRPRVIRRLRRDLDELNAAMK